MTKNPNPYGSSEPDLFYISGEPKRRTSVWTVVLVLFLMAMWIAIFI